MTGKSLGTVVVTGGAGFIGCALSQMLAPLAERWIAVDSLNPRVHASPERPAQLHEAATLVVGDIRDASVWRRVVSDVPPEVVIHLAAETDTGLSLNAVTRFSDVNATGTAIMLDAFGEADILPSHLLVASTRAVYGEGQWREQSTGHVFTPGQRTHGQLARGQWDFPGATPMASASSDTAVRPTSIYGATKFAQESMMSAWAGGRGVPFTALRLQNVYGRGQSLINPYTGILPLFAQAAARGQAIDVYEDGLMSRDFVHIDDVARAFADAVGHPPDVSRVTDIGCGRPATVLEVARLVADVVGGPMPRVSGRFRDGDVRHAWCSTDQAADTLGWRPEVPWETGIAEYARWVLESAEARG
ncbi:dTDP-L-rhamnose 4-epimerase [Microbacterium sp. AK009]|uniref:NAD-dependent epimerase/dehydratase family protein n=1 Tax=Microbacterium sp. AK009 TaxID=2723068 RepID=UPI0015C8A05F|nr:NAD-dependent epimerase/dehydratase family protein [Microbacterium sp. AK009]NYF15846.1 dTDP-L-rhamnose 4-epimerase [Microbacterium sp. AK009]